ncbi:Ophiobolin F synthase [Talaromyces pinophilus]|nr:Ophiobolin F synthase [Talaromyces pinophilus]
MSADKFLFSCLQVFVLFFQWARRSLLSTQSRLSAAVPENARLEPSKPISEGEEEERVLGKPASAITPRYSNLVDPSTYNDLGLCSSLPLRVHKFAHLADKGALRAQEDWKRLVGPIRNFTGCLSPRFNGIAVAVPECIPERLEIVTYANEFAFLHDDILDNVGKEEGDHENNEMAAGFGSVLNPGDNVKMSASGKSQMQAKLILELLAINEPQAMVLLKCWEGLVKGESGSQHFNFQRLDEYLPHRVINLGQTYVLFHLYAFLVLSSVNRFWFGIITFAMGLTISPDEAEKANKITDPAYATLALANDYFSWEKEYIEFKQNPTSDDMANAIWIIMKEHSVDLEEAKKICQDKIRESCKEYVRRKREFERQATGKVSTDLLRYLSALEFSISGNVVWSQYTHRYNFGKPAVKENEDTDDEGAKSDDSKTSLNDSTDSTVVDVKTTATSGLLSSANDVLMTRTAKSLVGPILDVQLPELPDKVILSPSRYVKSLPSKKIRHHAIDALNIWFNVPEAELEVIKEAIDLLHNSSLMLDDIEDDSPLRRGFPSTHVVYGISQTINSANYLYVMALEMTQRLNSPACLNVFIDELKRLHIGQSLDLYWTANVQCPSLEEYLRMVDYKTGGLFQMVAKLMAIKSPMAGRVPDLSNMTTLFGRYFQIRDDYQNLTSEEYTNQKGWCEDLDEGKFSLPLIHSLTTKPNNIRLQAMLHQRLINGKMTLEMKKLALDQLAETKSLEYTKEMLGYMYTQIQKEVEFLERQTGSENFLLRLLLKRLQV